MIAPHDLPNGRSRRSGRGPPRTGGEPAHPGRPDARRSVDHRPGLAIPGIRRSGPGRAGSAARRPARRQPLRLLQDDRSELRADRRAPARAERGIGHLPGHLEGTDVRRARRAAARAGRDDPRRHRRRVRRHRAQARAGRARALGRPPERHDRRDRRRNPGRRRQRQDGPLQPALRGDVGDPRRDRRPARRERGAGPRPQQAQGPGGVRQEGDDRLCAALRGQPRRAGAEGRAADRARLPPPGRGRRHGGPGVELSRRDRARAQRGGGREDAVAAQGDPGGDGGRDPGRRSGREDRQLQPQIRGALAHPARDHRVAGRQSGARLRPRSAPRSGALRPKGQGALRASRGPELRLAGVQGRPGLRALLAPAEDRRQDRGSGLELPRRHEATPDGRHAAAPGSRVRAHQRRARGDGSRGKIVDWNSGRREDVRILQGRDGGPDAIGGRLARGRRGLDERRARRHPRARALDRRASVRPKGRDHGRLRHRRRAALRRVRASDRRAGRVPRRDRPQEPRAAQEGARHGFLRRGLGSADAP